MTEKVKAPKRQKRIFYISVLNVLACFGVVALHCTNSAFWNYTDSRTWVTGNLVETLFYFPVPIFFMLSGATLLEYRERYSTEVYLKKRFSKTVIPFLAWSVVAYIYWVFWVNDGVWQGPRAFLQGVLNTEYMSIYWFFLPLFAIYLSIPVLSMIQDKLKVFRYAIYLGLIFVVILPLIFDLLGVNYNENLTPPLVMGWMIYVFLGYNLSRVDLSLKQRRIIYICGILGWVMQFFGTWWLSAKIGKVDETFKGYTNLPCVMQAVAVFVLFKQINYEKWLAKFPKLRLEKLINWLAGVTFGIYLIHGYIVYTLPDLWGFSATSWVWRTFGTVAVFVASAGTTWALQKIPLVRRIVP